MLLSSFSDGLQSNPEAQDWLCDAIVENLWKEEQLSLETSLKDSNEFSPCNGPDITKLEQLERIDEKVKELYPTTEDGSADDVVTATLLSWRQSLDLLLQQRKDSSNNNNDNESDPLELRIVYIPTALYALRKDSTNTPGKQRQRARADGKKRRNLIVQMLSSLMGDRGVSVSAVTLDFEDGSIKQPESTCGDVPFPS
ncbi:MAG: hypothetical protein SGARI_002701, partial [Bacillariaceae sp.]